MNMLFKIENMMMECTTAVFTLMIGATLLTALVSYFYYNKKIKALNETLESVEEDADMVKKKCESLLNDTASLSQQNHKLKQELAESETLFIATNQELKGAKDWLKEAEDKESSHDTDLKNVQNELYVLKYRVQALTEELQNTKNATDKLENDKNLVMDAYKTLQKQYLAISSNKPA